MDITISYFERDLICMDILRVIAELKRQRLALTWSEPFHAKTLQTAIEVREQFLSKFNSSIACGKGELKMKKTSEMTFDELVAFWSGYLILEIGRGKFHSGVSVLIQSIMQEAAQGEGARKRSKKA